MTRVLRATQVWNLTTQLGGVTLTSLPDVVRPLMAYGFRSYAKGMKNTVGSFFKGSAVRSASKQEINRFGVALERVRNQRGMDIADVSMEGAGVVARKAGYLWGRLSLFNAWTDTMEALTTHVAVDWTLRQATEMAAGKALPRAAIARLSRMGLDADTLGRMLTETRRADAPSDGLLASNTMSWADGQLAKDFEGAIGSDVRRAIVRIGVGDRPAFMDDVTWQWLTQYMSFAMAATNRMLVAGVQQRDGAMLAGLLSSVALGAGVRGTKGWLRGDDPGEWSSSKWMLEGIDGSGMAGIWNPAFRFMQMGMGDTPSRYLQRDVESLVPLAGPTVGNIGNLARAGAQAYKGNLGFEDKGAAEYLSRATPFLSNTLHIRQLLLRAAED
ncbi:unnamed protein product [marine sediment metagenome]|uniref:Uncharacterized protein n=1 Tax=marine sediment metagenome TaxID=412755 RepID=X0RYS1_9ZZZZ